MLVPPLTLFSITGPRCGEQLIPACSAGSSVTDVLDFPTSISAIAEAGTCQRPDPVWWKSTGQDAARRGCAGATAVKGTAHKFAS